MGKYNITVTGVDLFKHGMIISWSDVRIGCGTLTLSEDSISGELAIDTEHMRDDFVRECLEALANYIFDNGKRL